MAHDHLYERKSSYDTLKPWPVSTQADTRDLRDPERFGLSMLSLKVKPLSRAQDLLEAAR